MCLYDVHDTLEVKAWDRSETVSRRVLKPHFYTGTELPSYPRSVESNKIILKQLIGKTEKERDQKENNCANSLELLFKVVQTFALLFFTKCHVHLPILLKILWKHQCWGFRTISLLWMYQNAF